MLRGVTVGTFSAHRTSRCFRALLATCAAMTLVACGLDPYEITIGIEATGGRTGGGTGGMSGLPGEAGTAELRVHIEDRLQTPVSDVTLPCGTPCIEVRAVVQGGNAPFVFHWNDGVATAQRLLCPVVSTEYFVSATDTAIRGTEFDHPPQTAAASVTVTVAECPTADAGRPDSGSSAGPLCVTNPSLEGTPGFLVVPFDAAPWVACDAVLKAFLANESQNGMGTWVYPPASDLITYAVLAQNAGVSDVGSRIGQRLCAPIPAHASRSFLVDAARAQDATNPGSAPEASIRIEGGAEACAPTEVLWTSPSLPSTWTTLCVTLQPTVDTTSLTFGVIGYGNPTPGAVAGALVDHIVPVESCP